MAEYAHQCGITHKPAFSYWEPRVLKKSDAIISLFNNSKPQYLMRTHKFGVELPKYVYDAHAIDKNNGNNFWANGISKEVKNVQAAFDIVLNGHRIPQNNQFVHCHMTFDMNMEDFRRKARYSKGSYDKFPAHYHV